MKQKKLSRQQAEDLELVRSSELFDEGFYREQNPDLADTHMDLARHYLHRGGREGRDPSAGFSSSGYLERYRDVKYSTWNPLLHYLRAGREEGRLPDPMADDARIIRESGYFDEPYYRHLGGATVPDHADAVEHYLREGADLGLDPSEDFSTTAYLRLNHDIVETGLNPLVHFLRHGRAAGRDSSRGKPWPELFRARYDARWADLAPFPVVRVPGVGPRVTVLVDRVDSGSEGEDHETVLLLGVLLANSLGASLRVAARHRPPDASVLLRVGNRNSVALLGDVELCHLPSAGSHPLLMGEREVVVTADWRTTRAVLQSPVREDEIVRVVLDDERLAYPPGDERLLCSESLAAHPDVPILAAGQGLLDQLTADYPQLGRSAVTFEPAFPRARVAAGPAGPLARTLLFLADPGEPRHLFWRGGQALCEALELNVVDPAVWNIVTVGADPEVALVLSRQVRARVLDRQTWQDQPLAVDAVFAPHDGRLPSRAALGLAASGIAVLTNGDLERTDIFDVSANLLPCGSGQHSMVEGLGHLAALGLDDDRRLEHRRADAFARDWAESTAAAIATLHERFRVRLGVGAHVH